jgi:hypothetical protein
MRWLREWVCALDARCAVRFALLDVYSRGAKGASAGRPNGRRQLIHLKAVQRRARESSSKAHLSPTVRSL